VLILRGGGPVKKNNDLSIRDVTKMTIYFYPFFFPAICFIFLVENLNSILGHSFVGFFMSMRLLNTFFLYLWTIFSVNIHRRVVKSMCGMKSK